MKVGDLVRIKFITSDSIRRAKHQLEHDPGEPGIIMEVAHNACKVIFPSASGKIRSFLISRLELID